MARLLRYIHPHVFRYAQMNVPCRQTIIRRNRVELFLTVILSLCKVGDLSYLWKSVKALAATDLCVRSQKLNMAEYGEWNRKGATLSDKTAKKEYEARIKQKQRLKALEASKNQFVIEVVNGIEIAYANRAFRKNGAEQRDGADVADTVAYSKCLSNANSWWRTCSALALCARS